MSRFFVEPEQISHDGFITITGTDVKHMRDVLRMARGDKFLACDSSGMEYSCELESFLDGNALGKVLSQRQGEAEPETPVILLQGVPKGDKMELIIQKNVELGVNLIIPITMEHCVVKFKDQKDIDKKTERWNRIATEASKQCGRLKVPRVLPPMSLKEAIKSLDPDILKFVAYEKEQSRRLKELLRNETFTGLAFIVGPEGGISPQEMSELGESGFISISLGKRILRTETAGFAIMASIRYELED